MKLGKILRQVLVNVHIGKYQLLMGFSGVSAKKKILGLYQIILKNIY